MTRNSHKIEPLQTEQALLKKLQSASLALARALSPDEVLRIAGDSIRDILSCDIVWVLLADESGRYLKTCKFTGPNNLPSINDRFDLRKNDILLVTVFKDGDPLFLDYLSTQNDPMVDSLIDRFGLSSLNLLPLSLPDGNTGILVFGKINTTPLSVEEKRTVLVFAHQVTISLERARLYNKEQESAAELAKLNELKSRLLHTLSHELKTPLTSLRTSAAFLKEYDVLDKKTRTRLIDSISRATDRLINVADDLYPVADALTAELKMNCDDVDCRQIAEEAIESIQSVIGKKDQTFNMSVDEYIAFVPADKERVKQALFNLLANASNFSPAGSNIEVTIQTGESEVIFGVNDKGIGISQKDQRSIFNGFYQADDETVRRSGGKGIGLLLAKTIVELHGGKIWVESQQGKGSSFYFSIPTRN